MAILQKVLLPLVAALLFQGIATSLQAAPRTAKPYQVHGILSPGNGFAGGIFLKHHLYAGLETFNIEQGRRANDVNLKGNWNTKIALVRVMPFLGGTYLEAGLAQRAWSLVGEEEGQNFRTIGSSQYNTTDYKVKVSWPTAGSVMGLGWMFQNDSGFSGLIGFTTIIGAEPDFIVTSTGVDSADLASDEKAVEQELEDLQPYTYLRLSLGFNF